MLIVSHPPTYASARRYSFKVLLGDFLGLEFCTEESSESEVVIRSDEEHSNRSLRLTDIFFQTPKENWLKAASLPKAPFPLMPETKLPILFGAPNQAGNYYEVSSEATWTGCDIFGASFFLLSRYEEIANPQFDIYGRFPSIHSTQAKAGCLGRPLVNEYVELLWELLSNLWPSLKRKVRRYEVSVSHDVDTPIGTIGRKPSQVIKSLAADFFRRGDFGLALRRIVAWVAGNKQMPHLDPCNTFDFIMKVSEQAGIRSAFYFFAGNTNPSKDGNYSLGNAWFRSLLKEIHHRGHEIGLHTSFETYLDANQTAQEFNSLRLVCEEEGIHQPFWGGRQHYLRWQNPYTWRNWSNAGLHYDSSLGYADEVGFRSGVCYEHSVFDLFSDQALDLIERPLVVMEGALLVAKGCSLKEAAKEIHQLSEVCRKYSGQFSLLWHNSMLTSKFEKASYESIISSITAAK